MPTPVSSARQCLTDEAARALDDAVVVARRRSHSQTTSLHAVSALLSLPSSTLRDACARARSSAYSPRLQFRALELCVSVSLDRLPASKSKNPEDEPPVSNSLMAAIKRSQANQRRHPETFHLYQMHQQLHGSQTASLSCVKVEIKHFILSILDDPIVSRVFGDAGFRSTDIKIAVLHPPPVSGFPKPMRFPPLFLCNLPDSTANRTGFNFPFAVDQGEEDFKRIGQILIKKTAKNPLLIGEIEGLEAVAIEKEIREFVLGDLSEEMMDLKLKEVSEKVESCKGCGVIVNFGELKLFVDGGTSGLVEHLVSQLSGLVRSCGGKLWLIGAVGSYETYMKILAKFPGLEKDWDLNLLPITCSKLSTNGSPLKSSLMGSFVPFGGFFPVPTELENSSSNTDQSVTRCSLCNEKYEHEVSVALKRGRTGSVADQQSMGLTSWLQVPESDTSKGSNVIEAKDHGGVFNALVAGLQRKWNDICHRLHQHPQNNSHITPAVPFPRNFPSDPMRTEITRKDSNQERFTNLSPPDQRDFQNPQHVVPTVSSEPDNGLPENPPVDFFATKKKLASTTSSPTTSITTDLGLGTIYVAPDLDPKLHDHRARIENFSGSGSAEVDEMSTRSYDKDYKALYRAIADKVRDRDGTVRAVSRAVSRCRSGNRIQPSCRRDVWLMFSGSDRVGKKKVSTALAEVVFGSRESLIVIDLNFENQIRHPSSVFDRQSVNFCDLSFRGKTVTDFVAEELSKKPRLVILLEHIDKADSVTQENLSRAIRTGKLSDSRGRETRITDAIFVTTSSSNEEADEISSYSEERILNAKALQMRISVESATEPRSSSILLLPTRLASQNPAISSKRKLTETGDFEIVVPAVKKSKSCFDLNLPVEETEESENESVSETKESWLEEFVDEVDEKVVFDPFDFDSNAETILSEIGTCFWKSFGSNYSLEIENEVMVQILASRWLSDRKDAIREWIHSVLFTGFTESKKKHRVEIETEIENGSSMVKLVAVEGVSVEDDGLCVCLPSKIMVK
ncbi:hypothetical protein OSB04_023439 [Centaurea solstitialis]|uniref:Clp R domain-containing protein n=1 Tax=Centaurea solstitialis TaxID=347529 RepID=A0AA38T2P7_9ASTR|nr:hypothetical protein OSB04_023439 [Centaurea solstitialis]